VAAAAEGADLAPLRAYLAAVRATDFSIAPDMEAFLQKGEKAGRLLGVLQSSVKWWEPGAR